MNLAGLKSLLGNAAELLKSDTTETRTSPSRQVR